MADRITKSIPPQATRAEVASVNRERRTFDLVWSTGAKVLRSSYWDGPFWEELSMDPKHVRMGRLESGRAPFLPDHDSRKVAATLGVIESARLEGGQGIATVRFVKAGVDLEADKVFEKIADKVIRNVSVGYRTYTVEKTEGVDSKIPTLRAVDWEPYEVSAVAIGADADAAFRSHDESDLNQCEFITKENRTMEPKITAVDPAEATRALEATVREEATRLERERISGIRSAVKSARLGEEFADKLIKDGSTLDAARAAVLEEMARRSDAETETVGHVSVTAVEGGDSRDKFVRGMSAWLFEKAGNKLVQTAKERGVKGFENDSLDGAEFRGASLVDVARICLQRAGVRTSNIYDRRKLVEMAFRASTSDFSVLFENVMYKSMRAAYAIQDDTWRRFCGTDTVADFKSANRYLNGSFGTLPVVNEGGEFRNVEIPDGSKVEIATETRGGIITLTRQAMINDDMGALLDTAVRFGRSAGKSIEKAVYDQLALNSGLGPTLDDSNTFFHASRGNLSTSAALSVAALDADRVAMRQQMDNDENDYLDLNPSILLIGVGLESAAKILNESSYDHTSNANLNKPNAVRGMFSDIVASPRVTAISTTRRYLFTAGKEAFKVVFLEGAGEGPTMETQDGFRVDGTEWKARIDFKVNPFDPKHALTNAGT